MENAKKQLKTYSIVVLLLAALSLVRSLVNIFTTDYSSINVDGAEEVLNVALVIAAVISFVVLLPQIFVGYRGLKVSSNPDSKGGYIVWAWILLIIAVIGVISGICSIASSKDMLDTILGIVDAGLDVVIFFFVIKYAKIVQKGAKNA